MSADGIWYVKLADGDVERVTLDQLDAAFQSGQIDENTKVLADGANQWMTLGELLGLSETPGPVVAPVPTSYARAPVARAPVAAVPGHQPATYHRPVAQPVQMVRPPAPIPSVPVGRSLRPVSLDLGSDVDLANLQVGRSSRKGLVIGALGTFLVLGAGAFVVTKNAKFSTASSDSVPQFAAAAALPAPATPPPEPVAPTPPTPPQPTLAGPSSVMDPTMRSSVMDPTAKRLTDDQKKKLMEADKGKPHAKAHGGGGGSWHPKEKSSSFTTDGNKFDPLNSTL